MYDIKFPQVVNTAYLKQCVNCPYMELTADTDKVYGNGKIQFNTHNMKCRYLEVCQRIISRCEAEQVEEDEEGEEDVWEEDKAN